MNSLNDTTLENNTYMKINFESDNLSSDARLLLVNNLSDHRNIATYRANTAAASMKKIVSFTT